ncbi:hypothetical protein [Fictibacillus terranigra]|uniref:hypothetical protein n=1 Tax=Fictibacillus terranigra TaxID=3058424 RepID=UPI003CD0CF6F
MSGITKETFKGIARPLNAVERGLSHFTIDLFIVKELNDAPSSSPIQTLLSALELHQISRQEARNVV